jgi:hypothetical protein
VAFFEIFFALAFPLLLRKRKKHQQKPQNISEIEIPNLYRRLNPGVKTARNASFPFISILSTTVSRKKQVNNLKDALPVYSVNHNLLFKHFLYECPSRNVIQPA